MAKNPYPGINAHLNSFLQHEPGGWESFHAELVVQIRVALDAELPPGYLALAEKSLQISEVTPSIPSRTRPDVTIYAPQNVEDSETPAPKSAAATATLSLLETVPEEESLTAVMIYQAGEGSAFGRPITRLEVLSPANKPSGSHYPRYLQKRLETLQSGLRLVELDFLHESRPLIRSLPSYPDDDEGAYPYVILVSDPRPVFEKGLVTVYGFSIGDPIPEVAIPLAGADYHEFACGAVYNRVFESLRFIAAVIDYHDEPLNIESYNERDRTYIQKQILR